MSVIQPTRRGALATSAAAAAASLLPERPAAAPDAINGATSMTDAIRPFRVDVPDELLVDLRRRLAATRWPDRETAPDESQGVQLATMQELARYWGTGYDWRKCEAKLNALPQFMTEIDGLDIHFIHVRSKHENALPLIVTHGWPGSVIEQLKIIDLLINPTAHSASASDAFHVVIPSLPGFGFSARPTTTGWGPDRTARAWLVLMKSQPKSRLVRACRRGFPLLPRHGSPVLAAFSIHFWSPLSAATAASSRYELETNHSTKFLQMSQILSKFLLGTVFAEASKRLVPKPGRLERPVLKSISRSHWNARYGADSGPPRRL
jgi:Epoxide hydrolase N terminus